MRPIAVTDPLDARIEAYRDIRERDLVGRRGLFVAEGTVVLRAMLDGGRFRPDSLLVLENRLGGISDLLDRLPEATPVYVAAQPVMDSIAGFHMHRGVLALGRPIAEASAASIVAGLPDDALIVVLVGISNHDNVGSIFRNAASFDTDAVLLDATSCDPLYRKATRVSVGATLTVPFARGGEAGTLLQLLKDTGFEILSLSPSGGEDIATITRPKRAALVLGTEGEGLPRDILQATRSVRIAMSQRFDSLNVAAASAVALHRLWRG